MRNARTDTRPGMIPHPAAAAAVAAVAASDGVLQVNAISESDYRDMPPLASIVVPLT